MKFLSLLIAACCSLSCFSQNVGIGTSNPDASALLELKSTEKGFLPPRMDSAQRVAILNPAKGLIVYDTDMNALLLFNGIRWVSIDQTNIIGDPGSRPNTSYTFSAPQFLIGYNNPNGISNGHNGITNQFASISENLIVFSTGVDYNSTSFAITCYFSVDKNGIPSSILYTIPSSTPSGGKLYCFDADSLEQNIYAVINTSLFRLNITNVADTTRIADGVGAASQIKVLGNGDIIIATDLNNGSLLRILPNGTRQTIAANLRFPNYFDVFGGNYYVTDLSAITGSVKKVTPAGVATTVVADVLTPRSIVFDKNGNFVLQANITINGIVYVRYTLYDATGQLVGPVNDASDFSILSTGGLATPMYIDNFNNLVFMHSGTASGTSVPNPVGSLGLWLLKLVKL